MKDFTIGGVPEHFNLPWHLNLESNAFKNKNYNVKWKDFPGGTGAMSASLRSAEIDMAIILTEGITKDIIDGNPSKIVQIYVESPLLWGIHVGDNSNLYTENQLQNKRIAISRMGSGSHLMAYIHAQNNYWNTGQLKFEIVGNIDGAVDALTNNKADYFLWEHFTTKPLVDKGIFRRIGNVPTPWPCFVIAVREEILDANPQFVKFILSKINETTKIFKTFPDIEHIIADRYDQKAEDIEIWLSKTEWSQQNITPELMDLIQTRLFDLKLIPHKIDFTKLVYNL